VRIGASTAPHPVDRAAEMAATRAAGIAGVGPELIHADGGTLVRRFVEGRVLCAEDLSHPETMRRAIVLLRLCRERLDPLYDGPRVDRSPKAVLGFYQHLIASRPNRWQSSARRRAGTIAAAVAGIGTAPPRLSHNDVHAANIVDDGERLWLLDWEYAGFAPPLIDVASLCVNGTFEEAMSSAALALWEEGMAEPVDRPQFRAACLCVALRDLFWGYAQDAFATLDHPNYIAANEARVAALSDRLIGLR
jgi:hypothetical protein